MIFLGFGLAKSAIVNHSTLPSKIPFVPPWGLVDLGLSNAPQLTAKFSNNVLGWVLRKKIKPGVEGRRVSVDVDYVRFGMVRIGDVFRGVVWIRVVIWVGCVSCSVVVWCAQNFPRYTVT